MIDIARQLLSFKADGMARATRHIRYDGSTIKITLGCCGNLALPSGLAD